MKYLLDKIRENQKIINATPTTNLKLRATALGRQSQAKEMLETYMTQYRTQLIPRIKWVVVSGSGGRRFNTTAEKNYGVFTVSGKAFAEKIVDQLDSRGYMNHHVSPGMFQMIGDILEIEAKEIGILSFPALIFEAKHRIKITSKKQMVDFLVGVFNEKMGGEINGIFAANAVLQKAVDEGFDGSFLPVFIDVEDHDMAFKVAEDLSILSKQPTQVITIGKQFERPNTVFIKKIDKDIVLQVLEVLKARMQGKPEPTIEVGINKYVTRDIDNSNAEETKEE